MTNLKYDENKLESICQKYNLDLVILHGSYVKDSTTSKSDIDIGILGKKEMIQKDNYDIINDFIEIFGDKFDPVFLNGAEPMITFHVAISGKPLYEKEKGMFQDFVLQAIARYMDTKKFRILEKEYVLRAAKEAK